MQCECTWSCSLSLRRPLQSRCTNQQKSGSGCPSTTPDEDNDSCVGILLRYRYPLGVRVCVCVCVCLCVVCVCGFVHVSLWETSSKSGKAQLMRIGGALTFPFLGLFLFFTGAPH